MASPYPIVTAAAFLALTCACTPPPDLELAPDAERAAYPALLPLETILAQAETTVQEPFEDPLAARARRVAGTCGGAARQRGRLRRLGCVARRR